MNLLYINAGHLKFLNYFLQKYNQFLEAWVKMHKKSTVNTNSIPEANKADIVLSIDKSAKKIKYPKLKEHLFSLEGLPPIPDVILVLDELVATEKTSNSHILSIIQQDPGLEIKILKLVNFSYLGFSGDAISSIKDAINVFGIKLFRDLVLTAKFYDSMQQGKLWRGFSFDHLYQRSIQVSQFAFRICYELGANRKTKVQARLAGLLIDTGMLALAKCDPKNYHQVMIHAHELNQPLHVSERLILGASHGQVGAYLLDQWGVSPEVVDAVLFHHNPNESRDSAFTPLTAIHLADSLLPQLYNTMGVNMGDKISRSYLTDTDAIQALPKWERIAHDVARGFPIF